MATSSDPTWYDVLGIAPDATPGEVKAAWRNATDKFEPGSGSGQFRMFNEAADVLLDPARRASYDAKLGADARPGVAAPPDDARPDEARPDEARPARRWKLPSPRTGRAATRATRTGGATAVRATAEPASRRAVWLVLLLALLSVAAVAAAVVLGLEVRANSRAAEARDAAPAAAERAAKEILSYDYRTLPADRDRAAPYMTPSFGKKYLQNFQLLEKQKDGTPGAAVQTKTTVTASVLGSGVVSVADDGGAAQVLVYVNQVSARPGRNPQIFQNRVAMTMKKVEGRWLVDDLKSY